MLSQFNIKPSFIKELIETNNYDLIKTNFVFFSQSYNSSESSKLLNLLDKHEYVPFFNELNDSCFDASLSADELNLWVEVFKENAHNILIDEFSRFTLTNDNSQVFKATLVFHFKLHNVIELILTAPEDQESHTSLLDTFRSTQEKKQKLTQEMDLLDIGSDEYIHTHESLLAIEHELLQIAKEVKSTKDKSNFAVERERLCELLQPLLTLGFPYNITSLNEITSIKTLYSSNHKILKSLTSQYLSLKNSEADSLLSKNTLDTVSQFHHENNDVVDFDLYRYLYIPMMPNLPSLLTSIELAQIHLNDLLITLDPENAEISKVAELPEKHKNIKNFRLYKQGELAILSTRRGGKILEFQSMEEADEWSRQFQLLNNDVKITNARPVPKKPKLTTVSRAYSTPALGKRTLVVGNANASSICKTCNGTGLWGNCRNCGGKGFL
ncbi:hypothetical protein ACE1OE_17170 [Vibrio sp. E150_011]